MTSLRSSTHLILRLPLPLALLVAGCPDTTSPDDAHVTADAFTPGLDAATLEDAAGATDDAFSETTDAATSDDAFSATTDAHGDDAPLPTSGAYVADACGPADGAALTLTISAALVPASCGFDPLQPSTSFYIHDLGGATLPPSAGATITSSASADNGSATECPGGRPPCRVSSDWSITFTAYDPSGGATGQYTITWEGGGTSTGNFDATRCESGPTICG